MRKGPRVSIAVADRILIHLLNHHSQADMHTVSDEITRRGIARACAVHPPNVSRSIRDLLATGIVRQNTCQVRGELKRQRVWHLTPLGLEMATAISHRLGKTMVLLRNKQGSVLEVQASEASDRLNAELDLLSVLMHAQHEGALNYGDIRFGPVQNKVRTPGSIKMMAGAHATYHTEPPIGRKTHGRKIERARLDSWYSGKKSICVVTGIAGCGKTTLVSDWFQSKKGDFEGFSTMYYPCQTWDTATGLATSIIHRILFDHSHDILDPYDLIATLPSPGNNFDYDQFRRRLTATLLDEDHELGRATKSLLILDDIHNLDNDGIRLIGALVQIAEACKSKIIGISRSSPEFYDRRDVLTRGRVTEIPLKGLTERELGEWIRHIGLDEEVSPEILHEKTGGHPLAIELLEMYGEIEHRDWVKFLDSEIVEVLPPEEKKLLLKLANHDRPLPWVELAKAAGVSGGPPKNLISKGLMVEIGGGLWLHEALRSRLRMYVENIKNS